MRELITDAIRKLGLGPTSPDRKKDPLKQYLVMYYLRVILLFLGLIIISLVINHIR